MRRFLKERYMAGLENVALLMGGTFEYMQKHGGPDISHTPPIIFQIWGP